MIRLIRKRNQLYNLTDGGDGGLTAPVSEERKQRLREQLAQVRTLEHQRAAARLSGLHHKESKTGIFSPSFDRVAHNRRIAGKSATRYPHIAQSLGTRMKAESRGIFAAGYDRRPQGRIRGKQNSATSGLMKSLATLGGKTRATDTGSSSLKAISSTGLHTRWHVNRLGGFNPKCELCFQVI